MAEYMDLYAVAKGVLRELDAHRWDAKPIGQSGWVKDEEIFRNHPTLSAIRCIVEFDLKISVS